MDDGEGDGDGGFSFDFEGGLDTAADGGGPARTHGHGRGRGSFRQTVCRHWLRGLCMKGDSCGFMHQYDKERMPLCRFFRLGECREQECIYKHSCGDTRECNMYRLGFCPNGPNCRYRHVKLAGPPPPVEEVFLRLQQANIFNYGSSSRYNQHRDNNYNQQGEKPQDKQIVLLHNQNSAMSAAPVAQQVQTSKPHHEPPTPPPQQQQNIQVQGGSDGSSNQGTRTSTPLPQEQSRCVGSFWPGL